MANDRTRRPWILDSVELVKSGLTLTTGFVFRDYTGGVGSQAVLSDSRGIAICKLNGDAGGDPVSEAWINEQPVENLTVTALDSGVIEVIVL